ncbi:uncharacterized protein LOC135843607 [Planococcus citri]|uniref:uncharacterized protein LOC135843607 n=1 Tax=Planococcus citri TaxID=170843 RepID=UPI0031F89423
MNPSPHIFPILLVGFTLLYNLPTTSSTQDFEELTKSPYFVDKTYMLKLFFSLYDLDRYLMVTAPRKFGKTVNLNMIKRFAQMEFDPKTDLRLPKNQTSSYRLFTNKSLNLQISQYPDLIEKHLAEYPVLYFDMKFNLQPNSTTDDIMAQLRVSVQNVYKEYKWVYHKLVEQFDGENKERKAKLDYMKKALDNTLDPIELAWCIRELNFILYEYFDKKVVLLINDYDSVMNDVIFNPGPNITDYYRRVGHIFYYALRYYETLDAVSYCIVSGISEIPFRANCPNFFEIQLDGFLRGHDLATCHGFTEDEVHELLDRHKIHPSQRDPIRDHYNGFFIDRSQVRMYNPYDIVSYLSDKNRADNKFPKYWIKTRPAKFLLRILSAPLFRTNFVELLLEEQVYFKRPGLVFGDEVAELMLTAEYEWEGIGEHELKVVYYFLYEHGYLSHTPHRKIYKVSNPEVHQEMSYFVRKWFMINTNVTTQHYDSIGDRFSDILQMEKVSQKALDDLSSTLKEAFHGVHYNNCAFINKLDLKEYDYRAIIYSATIWHKKVRVSGDIKVITTDLANPLPHLVVYNKQRDVIVMHVHYDVPAEKALKKAKAYYLHGDEKIRSKKFLGINVRPDFQVDVAFEDPKFTTTTVASSTSKRQQ